MVRDHARENMMNMDRRAHTLGNALEEARTMLEQADRARRWVFFKQTVSRDLKPHQRWWL